MADDRVYARHDLGVCSLAEPESVGPPGQRFFRIRAIGENGSAILWLEKEELHELASAVKRILGSSVRATGEPIGVASADDRADFNYKVTALSLGHDRDSGRYMALAHCSDEEGDAVALWLERDALDWLADRAFEVCDAGRPRCVFCGAPLADSARHACPRAN